MKIGIVHPYPVHSAAVGGTTRVFALVRHLAQRHEVSVFSHSSGDAEADERASRELSELGVDCAIEAIPDAGRTQKLRAALDGSTPYHVYRNRNPALETLLRESVRSGKVELVHTEFAYLAPLLEAGAEAIPWVLAEQETMSLVCERLAKLGCREKTAYQKFLEFQAARVRRFEAEVLPQFTRIYGITRDESQRMRELGGPVAGVLPHVVRTEVFAPNFGEALPARLLFVGNYAHSPNVQALRWFIDSVWAPLRARRPELELCVVGPGLAAADRQRVESRGARWLGRVEDLAAEYRRASVFVNPIHAGGGMRGKVLEALACGCPIVSTSIGMEGVDAALEGQHFLRADDAGTFASQVALLLNAPERRRALAEAGREIVVSNYDVAHVFETLGAGFEEALATQRGQRNARVAAMPPGRGVEARPGVSAQVVTWNHEACLDACLASASRQGPGLLETVVVDNASTDDSAERARVAAQRDKDTDTPARIRPVQLSENTGFCAGQNRALAETSGEWVLLLNPDACLPDDFIKRVEALLPSIPANVGTLAPLLLLPSGRVDSTGLTIDGLRRAYDRDAGSPREQSCNTRGEVFGATGAVALHRRAMLEDIAVDGDAFDETLFAYYDDLDVAWRAKLRGWRCLYVPEIEALHERGAQNALRGVAGRATAGPAQVLTVRNRLLVMAKCEGARSLLLGLPKLLAFELARALYLGVRSPGALRGYPQAARSLGAMLRARRIVRSRNENRSIT